VERQRHLAELDAQPRLSSRAAKRQQNGHWKSVKTLTVRRARGSPRNGARTSAGTCAGIGEDSGIIATPR
jgi:hypothetical protein